MRLETDAAVFYASGRAIHPKTVQHGARITVADTEDGMSAEVFAQLFGAFKGLKGSGLELWITKAFVEKHQGSMRFRSSTRPVAVVAVFDIRSAGKLDEHGLVATAQIEPFLNISRTPPSDNVMDFACRFCKSACQTFSLEREPYEP